MTIARWTLPELIRRPRVFWPGVLQDHLGAASLATNTDVGVVHGEILVHQRCGVMREGTASSSRSGARGAGQ